MRYFVLSFMCALLFIFLFLIMLMLVKLWILPILFVDCYLTIYFANKFDSTMKSK